MNGCRRGSLGSRLQGIITNFYRRTTRGQEALLALVIFAIFPSLFAQTPVTNGYRDFNFGSTVIANTTAEKPESKLWWNDGSWWGSLWNPASNKFRIHRFDLATQSWVNVGPDIDERPSALADALWDGQHLYIASHIHSGSQQSGGASAANSARLYRYSYNSLTKTYSPDAGFPVTINNTQSETLVLDKNSNGQLWAAWTQSSKTYLNRSLGNDLTWGTPFALPVQSSNSSGDDISTLIAFDHKIGVLWSNQNDKKFYFATHLDSKPDTDWEPQEIALTDPSGGAIADDHLNIKMTTDGGGSLFCAVKTSLGSGTGVFLLKRTFGGVWSKYEVAKTSEDYTRAVVVLDDENRELYVIVNSDKDTPGTIRMKKVSYDNLTFPTGLGDPFILSSSDNDINDPTVSKHNVNSTTGLLVIGSDEGTHYYLHNYKALSHGSTQYTLTASASGSGTVSLNPPGGVYSSGTVVTLTANPAAGWAFSSWSGNLSGSTNPATITMNGNKTVTANFTQSSPTQFTLTVNTAGSGTVNINPPGGTYASGTMVTLTAIPDAGYQFTGWSGDLDGVTNPATITMNANKNVTATFTSSNSGGSQVAFEESKTGSSSSSTQVATSANLTGVSGHLYLAAISTKGNIAVTGVAGLGLNWTLVKAQCSGRNNTGVEVWKAQGTPSGNGAVTATLAAKADYAVIAVSRYSGVPAANPLGNMVSGNTKGVNGVCSGGSDNKLYSFNLTTTANGAVVYGAAAMRDRSHTPGAGYTERAEIKKSSASVAVQDKNAAAAGPVILDGTFSSSVDWAVIGLEIKPSSSGFVTQYTLTSNVVGAGSVNPSNGSYDAGTSVMLTATAKSGYQFTGWSGDLSGSTNPATITMDGNKNVTATFTAIPIAHEESQTGGSASSTTVTTSANLTGVSGHLYLAAISTQPRVGVTAVSGLGLTWTLVRKQCAAMNSTGIEVWMAQGTPSSNGPVSATLASAPSAAVIAVSRYSNVAAATPIGNVISGNTNGMNASATCTGGVASDSYSFNLTTVASNTVIYSAAAMKARTHTPGASYTERAEINQVGSSLTSSVAVEDMPAPTAGTVTVNGSFNGTVDWAEVALAIKPLSAAKAGLIAADEATAEAPQISGYQLEQNYPNPFNPGTSIRYSLPQAGEVRLTIYNIYGQTVSVPVKSFQSAGTYTFDWQAVGAQGQALPSGVYFYRLEAGSHIVTRRMTLLR